jgi:hypothetical protein
MGERDIDTEYKIWIRMFGEQEADRLRINAEAAELLGQLDGGEYGESESRSADS